MFSDNRIPPLSEGQLRGLTKRRWNQYFYTSVALRQFLDSEEMPPLEELGKDKRIWMCLQKLLDKQTGAWLGLHDELEYGTVERLLSDIESPKRA